MTTITFRKLRCLQISEHFKNDHNKIQKTESRELQTSDGKLRCLQISEHFKNVHNTRSENLQQWFTNFRKPKMMNTKFREPQAEVYKIQKLEKTEIQNSEITMTKFREFCQNSPNFVKILRILSKFSEFCQNSLNFVIVISEFCISVFFQFLNFVNLCLGFSEFCIHHFWLSEICKSLL